MGGFTPPDLLSVTHQVDRFDCASPAQTEWLRRHASSAHSAGTSRVYVSCAVGTSNVAGYYALAAGQIDYDDASPRLRKGVGRHPIPVIVLTRLGVGIPHQSQGLGRSLVTDALRRVEQAADAIGVRALLIHAESAAARAYYLTLAEFEDAPSDPLHLVLLMKDLRKALQR